MDNYLPEIGIVLSIEEKAGLELAFNKLKTETVDQNVYLWGKINGKEADYFVAYTLSKPDYAKMPTKSFYYCRHYELLPFPEMDEWQSEKAALPGDLLKGTPNVVIEEKEIPEDEEVKEPENEEEEEKEVKPIQFKEIHRLIKIVLDIDKDISIIPKGKYIVDSVHDIIENKTFLGLSNMESLNLSNYFFFRDSRNINRINLISKAGIVEPYSFLDTIEEDVPKGIWGLTHNAKRTIVMLRNLKWPGYHFFHELNTNKFGGVYFGNGKPEGDLVFMV